MCTLTLACVATWLIESGVRPLSFFILKLKGRNKRGERFWRMMNVPLPPQHLRSLCVLWIYDLVDKALFRDCEVETSPFVGFVPSENTRELTSPFSFSLLLLLVVRLSSSVLLVSYVPFSRLPDLSRWNGQTVRFQADEVRTCASFFPHGTNERTYASAPGSLLHAPKGSPPILSTSSSKFSRLTRTHQMRTQVDGTNQEEEEDCANWQTKPTTTTRKTERERDQKTNTSRRLRRSCGRKTEPAVYYW